MAYLTYSEKLLDPKWQRKRLEVLNRDEFKCCLCSDAKTTLHIHHKTYEKGKFPWQYELDNFQTLCKYCHVLAEFFKNEKETILIAKKIMYEEIDYICYDLLTKSNYINGFIAYDMCIMEGAVTVLSRIYDYQLCNFQDLINIHNKTK